jgi:hypothetical protein
MQSFGQIAFRSVLPAPWNLFMLVVIILGIYISTVLLVNSRFRMIRGSLLGLYTAVLALFMGYISSIPDSGGPWQSVMQFAGAGLLFMIGPLSYLLFTETGNTTNTCHQVLYYLPALFAGLVALIIPERETLILQGGVLFTGCWLALQLVKVFRVSLSREPIQTSNTMRNHHWNKAFSVLQIFLFGIICISLTTRQARIIVAGCIALLILVIWIRLLYSAYLAYTTDRNKS